MAGFVVLWVICGLFAGVIASGKGLSFGAYFFVGLLLGPLGILIAAVSSRSPEAEAQRIAAVEQARTAHGTGWACPFCAEEVNSMAVVCKHCGREIAPVQRQAATHGPANPLGGNPTNKCKDGEHGQCSRKWCTCACHANALSR